MTMFKSNGERVPDFVTAMAESAKAGVVDRREFPGDYKRLRRDNRRRLRNA